MRGSVWAIFAAIALLSGVDGFSQETTIHGKVLDSRTAEPIAKATVSIRDRKIETGTSANGEFELPAIAPGEIELYVTTVGYALVRKKIEVLPSTPIELEILLGPEVLRRTDEITVTEKPFVEAEPASVSDHVLNQADMKNLTSVLIDDPLRSVQTLPGVTSGDDFMAQFSVRGAGFRSIGYATDGVLLYPPIFEVGDTNDGGSLSMLNGDVVEAMTLSTGGFSSKFGDRTAGYLNITTREGNHQRFTNTATASVTGLGWTGEGPIAKSKKASWLFATRKSYLDWLINKLTDDQSSNFIFGFKDFFAKVAFEPNAHHEIRLSGDFGNSRVDQTRNKELGPNDILFGDATNNIATAKWFWIVSNHFTLDSTISHDSTVLKNINHSNQLLFDTTPRQLTFKQDAAYLGPRHKIEAGYSARRLDQDGNRARVEFSTGQLVTTDQFSKLSWQPGAYIQDTVTGLKSRLTVTWGGRFDRLSLTGENVWMPRGSLAYSVSPKTRLTMAFGQYSEFPNFFQLAGQFANPALNAERATHYTMQMERSINDKTRVRVEVYDREDRNGIFSADTEYRLVGDHATGPGIPEPIQWNNSLRGHARGAEVFIERHSVNKLSGWVSYSYGAARYRDAATNLSFDGDFDQRHTLNSYATYRLKPTLNLSAKYRYGSNYPAAGFLTITGGPLRLNSERNRSHIPPYSRLDARANKAFNFDRWKLTLYGEVLNVLGRQNFRYVITTDTVNHFVSFDREDLFPRLPIAGIRLEF